MQERKDGHLNTNEEGRNSSLQIWVRQFARSFDDTKSRGGEDTEQETLPEREENHQFDGRNLQEWAVVSNIFSQLDIELNQAVHGDCNCHALNEENLTRLAKIWENSNRTYPDMRKYG